MKRKKHIQTLTGHKNVYLTSLCDY